MSFILKTIILGKLFDPQGTKEYSFRTFQILAAILNFGGNGKISFFIPKTNSDFRQILDLLGTGYTTPLGP